MENNRFGSRSASPTRHSTVDEPALPRAPFYSNRSARNSPQPLRSTLTWEERETRITTNDALHVTTLVRFDAVLASIQALPRTFRCEPLTTLAKRISYLPDSGSPARFDSVVVAIRDLPIEYGSEPLAALAYQIHVLPGAEREARFDGVFWAIGKLPAERRSWLLEALGIRIFHLPVAARKRGFDSLFKAIGELPVEHRSGPLSALADGIANLAKAAQSEAQAAVDAMRSAVVDDLLGARLGRKSAAMRAA